MRPERISSTYEAINDRTKARREVRVSLRHLDAVVFEITHDRCSGPCRCQVEPDGSCPQGWPSLSRVAGVC